MPNQKYVKGRRKEYRIVNREKNEGADIAFRSAGSHSPVDVFSLRIEGRIIKLIQSKSDNLPESEKLRLLKEWERLDGVYFVKFEVE